MPHSLSRVLIHLIFSTKDRAPVLQPIASELYAYTATILNAQSFTTLRIGGAPDHIHILFGMNRTWSLADIVGEIKVSTSKWIKTKQADLHDFHWQAGYGCFSVSQSEVAKVVTYIDRQEEHHKRLTFQDEYRRFLLLHEVPFEEHYVWD